MMSQRRSRKHGPTVAQGRQLTKIWFFMNVAGKSHCIWANLARQRGDETLAFELLVIINIDSSSQAADDV